MTQKTIYVVLKLLRDIETNTGLKVRTDGAQGMAGVMAAFETKTAARKVYGRNVQLMPAYVDYPDRESNVLNDNQMDD